MYPAEKMNLSLEDQHANRICINFLGQDLLVQALWESEEGIQARVWPRLLVVIHIPQQGRKHSAAGRAGGAGPHFPAPRLHPWHCHTAPSCALGAPELSTWAHIWCPHAAHHGGGCPGSPVVLLLSWSITILTTPIMLRNVPSALRAGM